MEEMLKKLGLSMKELEDLLSKLSLMFGSLNKAQQKVVRSSTPTLAEAASWFGRDVTADDLEDLLEKAAHARGATICANVGVQAPLK